MRPLMIVSVTNVPPPVAALSCANVTVASTSRADTDRSCACGPDPGDAPVEGRDHPRPELPGVAVRLVEREPRHRQRRALDPPGDDRRLAGSGRRHHQGQRRADEVVEKVVEPSPTHEVDGRRGRPELRPEQR